MKRIQRIENGISTYRGKAILDVGKMGLEFKVATVDARMLQRTKRGNVKIIFKNMQANYSKFRIDCCLKSLPRTKRLNQKKNKVTRNLFFVFSIIF